MRAVAGLVVAALAFPVWGVADAPSKPKSGKPHLELRATPRFAFSPVTVSLTAELKGGEEDEQFNCPELLWEWDDGGKSVHEADCAPLTPGGTIERRYTAEHEYKRAGIYNVKLTLRRASRTLATQSVKVTVRAGYGDPTMESPEN